MGVPDADWAQPFNRIQSAYKHVVLTYRNPDADLSSLRYIAGMHTARYKYAGARFRASLREKPVVVSR